MRWSQGFSTPAAARLAAAITIAVGSEAALAMKSNAPVPEQQIELGNQSEPGSVEFEIMTDPDGRHILVDPQSGEAFGYVLEMQTAPEIKPYTLNNAQLRAATAAKLSVTDVIVSVEQHSSGKVLEASFEPIGSAATYSLKTYREGAIWEGRIDADSGTVLDQGKTTLDNHLDADDKAELSGLETASTTILEAIRIAEQHTQGKAIAVGLEERDVGGAVWEVVVVTGDKARRVFVDLVTGQVRSS
jgi:uncharacterized membrane protein YkoI